MWDGNIIWSGKGSEKGTFERDLEGCIVLQGMREGEAVWGTACTEVWKGGVSFWDIRLKVRQLFGSFLLCDDSWSYLVARPGLLFGSRSQVFCVGVFDKISPGLGSTLRGWALGWEINCCPSVLGLFPSHGSQGWTFPSWGGGHSLNHPTCNQTRLAHFLLELVIFAKSF